MRRLVWQSELFLTIQCVFQVQLKKHVEIVHQHKRDYFCGTCGASFGTNSVLKMHLLSHQEFRAEKCEVQVFKLFSFVSLSKNYFS